MSPLRSSSTGGGVAAWRLTAAPRPAPRSAAATRYVVAPPPRSGAAPRQRWVPARAAAKVRAAKAMPAADHPVADPTRPAVRPAVAPPAAAAARPAAAVGADRRAVGHSKHVDRITQCIARRSLRRANLRGGGIGTCHARTSFRPAAMRRVNAGPVLRLSVGGDLLGGITAAVPPMRSTRPAPLTILRTHQRV